MWTYKVSEWAKILSRAERKHRPPGTQEPVKQDVPFLIFPNDNQDNHVDGWIFNRNKSGEVRWERI